MNKRMILVTPLEAMYCDRYVALMQYVEANYNDVDCFDDTFLVRIGQYVFDDYLISRMEDDDCV